MAARQSIFPLAAPVLMIRGEVSKRNPSSAPSNSPFRWTGTQGSALRSPGSGRPGECVCCLILFYSHSWRRLHFIVLSAHLGDAPSALHPRVAGQKPGACCCPCHTRGGARGSPMEGQGLTRGEAWGSPVEGPGARSAAESLSLIPRPLAASPGHTRLCDSC